MKKEIDDDFLNFYMPKAENYMLEKIPPENELSHIFSKRFNRKMKKLLKYERRSEKGRLLIKRLKITAAASFILLALIFSFTMSVDAYRVRFFHFISHVWEGLTSIVIESNDNADKDKLLPIESKYIPDGYRAVERTIDEYEHIVVYQNSQNNEIFYSQRLLSQGEIIIDTEDTAIEKITIEPQEVYLMENKSILQVHWTDSSCSYVIIGAVADKTELINMVRDLVTFCK